MPGDVNRWQDGYLTRDEVARLLVADCLWTVTYCAGSVLPPVSGRGRGLPAGGLERIPTTAAKGKLKRGTASKTYFRAVLSEGGSHQVLELVEDL